MQRIDPYKLMTLIFGVLLVAALIVMYFIATGSPQPGGFTNQPNNASIGLNGSNNSSDNGNALSIQGRSLILSNTTGNKTVLKLQKLLQNSSGVSSPMLRIAPGECMAPVIPNANLSIQDVSNTSTGYYLVSAAATQQTSIDLIVGSDEPAALPFISQNFTIVMNLRVPVSERLFFCNPSSTNDTLTYKIAKYG